MDTPAFAVDSFSVSMIDAARQYKISPMQSFIVYEIVRFIAIINGNDDAAREEFKLRLMKRLNATISQREKCLADFKAGGGGHTTIGWELFELKPADKFQLRPGYEVNRLLLSIHLRFLTSEFILFFSVYRMSYASMMQ